MSLVRLSFSPHWGLVFGVALSLLLGGCPAQQGALPPDDAGRVNNSNNGNTGGQNSGSDNSNNNNNNGGSTGGGNNSGGGGGDQGGGSGDNGSGTDGSDGGNSGGGPPVDAPLIKAIPNQAVSFGANYRSPTPKLEKGTAPITWSLVAGPQGATVNTTTGVVSWSNVNIVGQHSVQIRATNAAGADDEDWVLTVNGSGLPPVINEIQDATITAGASYTSPTPALAQGTPPITWNLDAGPDGATINTSSGVVNWPNPVVGNFLVSIRASGPGGFDTETWTLTVQDAGGGGGGIAPLIVNIPDNTILAGTPYTGPTPILSQGTAPINWTLDAGPSGMTINAATGVVTWPNPAAGQFSITIRAANATGADTEEWKLTVENPGNGQSPVIGEVPDATILEGAPYTGPTPALLQGVPPITWSLDAGPAGMTIDANTGVVSWNIAALGQFGVTIRAANTAGADTESWTLTVEAVGGSQSVWRVSVGPSDLQGNGLSQLPAVSANAQIIAFESFAFNLIGANNDNNGVSDIFIYDQLARQTTRVSVGLSGQESNGGSRRPALSSDGRYVAFESDARNLVALDTGGVTNVFVYDRQTGQTELISVGFHGEAANGLSQSAAISADGRYVAFESVATNLIERDSNENVRDIYVRDRQTGQTRLASVSTDGSQGGLPSYLPSISADGRYVAFESFATNLVANDLGDQCDVFVRDTQDNVTTLVSVSSAAVQGDGPSQRARIDAAGRYVVFESAARNLVATSDFNNNFDVFRHDRQTGQTTLISIDLTGTRAGNNFSGGPAITPDGRYVVFYSVSTDLTDNDATTNNADIFIRDTQTGATTLLSVSQGGAQGDLPSQNPIVTPDGRFVIFESRARNLVANDSNGVSDIFVRDRTR